MSRVSKTEESNEKTEKMASNLYKPSSVFSFVSQSVTMGECTNIQHRKMTKTIHNFSLK